MIISSPIFFQFLPWYMATALRRMSSCSERSSKEARLSEALATAAGPSSDIIHPNGARSWWQLPQRAGPDTQRAPLVPPRASTRPSMTSALGPRPSCECREQHRETRERPPRAAEQLRRTP